MTGVWCHTPCVGCVAVPHETTIECGTAGLPSRSMTSFYAMVLITFDL